MPSRMSAGLQRTQTRGLVILQRICRGGIEGCRACLGSSDRETTGPVCPLSLMGAVGSKRVAPKLVLARHKRMAPSWLPPQTCTQRALRHL